MKQYYKFTLAAMLLSGVSAFAGAPAAPYDNSRIDARLNVAVKRIPRSSTLSVTTPIPTSSPKRMKSNIPIRMNCVPTSVPSFRPKKFLIITPMLKQ